MQDEFGEMKKFMGQAFGCVLFFYLTLIVAIAAAIIIIINIVK